MADKKTTPKHSFVSLGSRVRELRKERNMTQKEFGAMIGYSDRYIGGIERGERNLSYSALTWIACACELSLSEFFNNVDDSREIVYGLISIPREQETEERSRA